MFESMTTRDGITPSTRTQSHAHRKVHFPWEPTTASGRTRPICCFGGKIGSGSCATLLLAESGIYKA